MLLQFCVLFVSQFPYAEFTVNCGMRPENYGRRHEPKLKTFVQETRWSSNKFSKVGPFCRNGLSPQGEPMGNQNPRKTEPTRTIRRAVFEYGTPQGRRSRRGREVPLGKRDLRRSSLPEWTFAARRTDGHAKSKENRANPNDPAG